MHSSHLVQRKPPSALPFPSLLLHHALYHLGLFCCKQARCLGRWRTNIRVRSQGYAYAVIFQGLCCADCRILSYPILSYREQLARSPPFAHSCLPVPCLLRISQFEVGKPSRLPAHSFPLPLCVCSVLPARHSHPHHHMPTFSLNQVPYAFYEVDRYTDRRGNYGVLRSVTTHFVRISTPWKAYCR